LWSHNDSGNEPFLFAFTASGADLGTYTLEGAQLVDWEDLAIGPGPEGEKSYLYVADTGANDGQRDYVSVYRVEEPFVSTIQVPLRRKLSNTARFDFVYPRGVSYDAEALMLDPKTNDLYIVTKPRNGFPLLFRARAPLTENVRSPLEPVAILSAIRGDLLLPPFVTSADISRDGRFILIRTYLNAYLWQRALDAPFVNSFEHPPCNVPLQLERQGEAIAFSIDASGYYTLSEGPHPAIHFFERDTSLSK
jgi:hypothetical protein